MPLFYRKCTVCLYSLGLQQEAEVLIRMIRKGQSRMKVAPAGMSFKPTCTLDTIFA